jgi:Zn-dependent peptidase ImmA (M78 family)
MFRRGFKTSAEETSQKIRRKLDLAPTAPVNARAVARLLGIPILAANELEDLPKEALKRLKREHSDAWSALTVSDGRSHLIVINDTHSETRTNSSLVHEVAHVILGHDPSMMFVMPQHDIALRTHNKEQEDEANWLAGCILLPRDALLHVRRLAMSDDQICATYGVSPAMLRFRLNSTGVDVQLRRARSYRR